MPSSPLKPHDERLHWPAVDEANAPRWRVLLVGAGLSLAWGIVVSLTGGFVLNTSSGTISSTDASRPFVIAMLMGGVYAWRRHEHVEADLGRAARWHWAAAIGRTCAAIALVYGLEWGTFIGGGPDQSGYVSEADAWVHGTLETTPPAWAQRREWDNAIWSSAPVGYHPTTRGTIAPVYSPGLPMLMAVFEAIGGRDAVYYVVPILGAAAVWGAYLLGVYFSSEWAGAIAAFLMLCSAPFLLEVPQPMSDVAVTGLWTLALALAWRTSTRDALLAGLAGAAAILVRPNIVPLAVVPALLLLTSGDGRVRRVLLFSAPIVPAAILIAALNARWWGSPFISGYGTLGSLFSMKVIAPNTSQYLSWLFDTQTPLMLAGLAAPLFVARSMNLRLRVAIVAVLYPVLVLALYVPYLRFEEWHYLRFLLPAYPAVLAGLGAVMVESARGAWRPSMAKAAVLVVAASIGIQEWRYAETHGAFLEASGQRRFARAVDFVNSLPANTIVLSNAYSGTLRFYTHRDVVRFEVLAPNQLDYVVMRLREQGHPVYFVGDEFEVDRFKEQFHNNLAAQTFEAHRLPDTGEGFVAADFDD